MTVEELITALRGLPGASDGRRVEVRVHRENRPAINAEIVQITEVRIDRDLALIHTWGFDDED